MRFGAMRIAQGSAVSSRAVRLLLVSASTATAGPPTEASGEWLYLPSIVDVRTAGCNTFLDTTEVGIEDVPLAVDVAAGDGPVGHAAVSVSRSAGAGSSSVVTRVAWAWS